MTVEKMRIRPGSASLNSVFEQYWVFVREFSLSYHHKEAVLLTIGPNYGNLELNCGARTLRNIGVWITVIISISSPQTELR